MMKMLAIASNTFREAIRDRILYGILFFAVCLILFSLVIGQLSFHEEIRATVDIGLSGISFFAVLMAIFLGITLLHKEIEKRTLYPVLSKPVARSTYLVGKFAGLVATLIVLIAIMAVVWFVVLGIQGGAPTAGMLVALLLVASETTLVIGMALFFTSFSSPFLSGLFCLGIFAAGRNAAFIDELARRRSMQPIAPLLEGISTVLPNLYLFYPSGKMVEGSWATVHAQFISSWYLLSAVGYAAVYTAVLVLLAVALFRRRDFI